MNDPQPSEVAAAAQRTAADPALSAWVGASAGTGKTTVLTDRLLRLLLAGTPPQRLLCLTFTKAAAAEMANRLNVRLARWATTDDGALRADLARLEGVVPDADRLDAARRLFARVLDAPGGMRIQTIHAFCQSLLARFPIEAGVPPHFSVADEGTAGELLDAALAATLADAPAGSPLAAAVATVARHAREDAFTDLLRGLLARRGRLVRMRAAAGGLDPLLARIADALGIVAGDTADGLLAEGCRDAALDCAGLRAAARALCGGSERESRRGAAIGAWLGSVAGRASGIEAYAAAFLTQGGTVLKSLVNKPTRDAYPAAEPALAAEAERLLALFARMAAATVREATAALLALADAVLARYEAAKAARAMLDYEDLILRTRALFEIPGIAPWVLYKLDGGLDHILVDEAQDTSPDQWAVVAALAEEFFAGVGARTDRRTIFAVGDVKQSIYSFQGADPDAFRRMRAHFQAQAEAAEQGWETVTMNVSFRSTEAILTAVDAVFATMPAREGLVDVARGDPPVIEHLVHRRDVPGRVELWPLIAPEEAQSDGVWTPPVAQRFAVSPPARLARRIAALVRAWTREAVMLPSRGRPIRPGDIMVLVRRRGAFAAQMVRAFKDAGVPVAGIDRMVLAEQIAVMDLLTLLRFVLLPDDELNLATLLKSPLVGLDEDALFALAVGRGRGTLWSALARRHGERADFAHAHAFLHDRLAGADFATPFAFLAETLGPLGGRRRLLDRLGPDAADPIDELLALALAYERAHPPGLEGFVHWLGAQATEIKREVEAGADAVRIMTVHGAKGLQAPIVFLPDTVQVPQRGPSLLWRGEDLMLWPPRRAHEEAVCRALREEADHRTAEEYRRLLYVAMTRAEDRLYVCGWRGAREPPGDGWHAMIDGALRAAGLGDEVPAEGWEGTVRRFDTEGGAVAEEAPPPADAIVASDPEWLFAPAPAEPTPSRPLVPSRPSEDAPAPRSPVGPDDGARFRRGLVIHRLLQTLPDIARERRREACRRFLALPAHGLDATTREAWTAETLAVLEDPATEWLFDAPGRAEVPIVGRVGAEAISGTIDRLVVGEREIVVLDYKTNRPPPEVEADVPGVYLRQMAAYRAAVARIYPSRPVRCALLWTDGPRLMWLSEAALAAAAPGGGVP
ncbi:MAG: double-strand break repair helicase AddA [Alphaproteobacteria bacterium]|nr:double-strand break repair helicase AddA [Alphaproteobacteria bacterium]